MRGTLISDASVGHTERISIHAPAWGATPSTLTRVRPPKRFQLTYPMRSTTRSVEHVVRPAKFQLTYPMRDTTIPLARIDDPNRFQLTHPMRGGVRLKALCDTFMASGTSTHVPHAWHGWTHQRADLLAGNFNSRTPCGMRQRVS